MKMSRIVVQNYRALHDIDVPLSPFVCLIGRNNAGKSSVLQTVSLFFSGSKLSRTDFFDPSQPIRIAIRFTDITDDDLNKLAQEHRQRIEDILDGGSLTLVRLYEGVGAGKLKYSTTLPKDERFSAAEVTALMKGKKGAGLARAVVEKFPELDRQLDGLTTQADFKAAIDKLATSLPPEQKISADADLPTGIDKSVMPLLPEPVYIPAVKNLADDTKLREGTPFGKVIGILLETITPELGDVAKFFADLSAKLNRIENEDGTVTDARLDAVKKIEQTVERNVRESFRDVSLKINMPPPELKAILSSAEILVNDGVEGPIETKGDGLRRAIVFAILRTYVELSQPGAMSAETRVELSHGRHVLLFEEPELYLHPSAQHVLFDALRIFSQRNYVVVSTHSPIFFGPEATSTFIKLHKPERRAADSKPCTYAAPIDLNDMKLKDQFQLICFENNNAAFFFDRVVLVEGDSDIIVFPHLARLLNPAWDCTSTSVRFVRVNGKQSIGRYREFFSRFNTRVAVVTDLDFLLDGFGQITPDAALQAAHSAMIATVDVEIARVGTEIEPNNKRLRDAQSRGDLKAQWCKAKDNYQKYVAGELPFDTFSQVIRRVLCVGKAIQSA
jgi:putative ATP-dependent endonuclease of the OLD family